MRRLVTAVAAALAGLTVAVMASAAPPQGSKSDAAFAGSYAANGVVNVSATTGAVSCYAPEVPYATALASSDGYPGGGETSCPGATTGEQTSAFATQDVSNPPVLVKDKSESDLRVDPLNPQHLIGQSKWFVSAEGYNHLIGFYESWDGGATWPLQGHVPGYEGWTDNTDPVGAFDPWGNFYSLLLPYVFVYDKSGGHPVRLQLDHEPRGASGLCVHGAQRHDEHAGQAVDRDRHESTEPALRTRVRDVHAVRAQPVEDPSLVRGRTS